MDTKDYEKGRGLGGRGEEKGEGAQMSLKQGR